MSFPFVELDDDLCRDFSLSCFFPQDAGRDEKVP
jgi:hypothetical protein